MIYLFWFDNGKEQ